MRLGNQTGGIIALSIVGNRAFIAATYQFYAIIDLCRQPGNICPYAGNITPIDTIGQAGSRIKPSESGDIVALGRVDVDFVDAIDKRTIHLPRETSGRGHSRLDITGKSKIGYRARFSHRTYRALERSRRREADAADTFIVAVKATVKDSHAVRGKHLEFRVRKVDVGCHFQEFAFQRFGDSSHIIRKIVPVGRRSYLVRILRRTLTSQRHIRSALNLYLLFITVPIRNQRVDSKILHFYRRFKHIALDGKRILLFQRPYQAVDIRKLRVTAHIFCRNACLHRDNNFPCLRKKLLIGKLFQYRILSCREIPQLRIETFQRST